MKYPDTSTWIVISYFREMRSRILLTPQFIDPTFLRGMPWHAAALVASGRQVRRQKLWTNIISGKACLGTSLDAVVVSSSQLANDVCQSELICRRRHKIVGAAAQREVAVGVVTARG
jgi:hypothetical protein